MIQPTSTGTTSLQQQLTCLLHERFVDDHQHTWVDEVFTTSDVVTTQEGGDRLCTTGVLAARAIAAGSTGLRTSTGTIGSISVSQQDGVLTDTTARDETFRRAWSRTST